MHYKSCSRWTVRLPVSQCGLRAAFGSVCVCAILLFLLHEGDTVRCSMAMANRLRSTMAANRCDAWNVLLQKWYSWPWREGISIPQGKCAHICSSILWNASTQIEMNQWITLSFNLHFSQRNFNAPLFAGCCSICQTNAFHERRNCPIKSKFEWSSTRKIGISHCLHSSFVAFLCVQKTNGN